MWCSVMGGNARASFLLSAGVALAFTAGNARGWPLVSAGVAPSLPFGPTGGKSNGRQREATKTEAKARPEEPILID